MYSNVCVHECGCVLHFKIHMPYFYQVDDLQEVVSSMAKLEEKVVMAENVCQQAIEVSR